MKLKLSLGVYMIFVAIAISATSANAQNEVVCQPQQAPFSGSRNPVWGAGRVSCSLTHAKQGSLVEGWVRGWAKFDRSSATVEIVEELETDSTQTGPCGRVNVQLLSKGKTIVNVDMGQDECINGKPPGKAVAKDFTFDKTILPSEAAQVDEVLVTTQWHGYHVGPWGWTPNFDDVLKAIAVVAAVAG